MILFFSSDYLLLCTVLAPIKRAKLGTAKEDFCHQICLRGAFADVTLRVSNGKILKRFVTGDLPAPAG